MFKPVSFLVTALLSAASNGHRCRNNPSKFPTPSETVESGPHDLPTESLMPSSISLPPAPVQSIYADTAFESQDDLERAPKPCKDDTFDSNAQAPSEFGPEPSTSKAVDNQAPGALDESIFEEEDELTSPAENVENGSIYPLGQPSSNVIDPEAPVTALERAPKPCKKDTFDSNVQTPSEFPIDEEEDELTSPAENVKHGSVYPVGTAPEPMLEDVASPEPIGNMTENVLEASEDFPYGEEYPNVPVPVPSRFHSEEDSMISSVKNSNFSSDIEAPSESPVTVKSEAPIAVSNIPNPCLKSGLYTISYGPGKFLGLKDKRMTGGSDEAQWEITFDEDSDEFWIRKKSGGSHFGKVISVNSRWFSTKKLLLKESHGSRFSATPTGLPNGYYLELKSGKRSGLWLAMGGKGDSLTLRDETKRTAFTLNTA